ncbi:putative protein kinase [Aspergillus lucknowensis]|uniref:non-specific serine/threonine protein kinase n=1 Tax=Aspergillus lucknowensis TaxID=176173 RepID=A0ABR4LTM8_9EURO
MDTFTVQVNTNHLTTYMAFPPPLPAKLLPPTDLVEEEPTPHYKPQHFYPIGWGTSSTVWLARDLHQWRWRPPRYVAIKRRSVRITEHITKANPQHLGNNFVTTWLDSFRVASPGGPHICMVFDALCEPLWMLKHRFEGNTMPLDVMKPVSKLILIGLQYLHTEFHVIRTDLKPDNILLALNDPSILDSVAQDEMNDPSPRKQPDSREIYLSRNYWGLSPDYLGDRYSVDIWNSGVMLCDLVYGHGPFDIPRDARGPGSADEAHLGRIISLLGPPPSDLLDRGRETSRYYGAQGQFKFPELIGKKDLLSMTKKIDDDDELRQFIDLISRMLRWSPEDRATAQDLISHPWLSQIGPANR